MGPAVPAPYFFDTERSSTLPARFWKSPLNSRHHRSSIDLLRGRPAGRLVMPVRMLPVYLTPFIVLPVFPIALPGFLPVRVVPGCVIHAGMPIGCGSSDHLSVAANPFPMPLIPGSAASKY